MPTIPDGVRRTLAGLFFIFPFFIILLLIGLVTSRLKPVQLTDEYKGASITYSTDRQWVWFPGDCVHVEWTLENVARATFFPVIEPGIQGANGVRSIFFLLRDYRPGPTVLEDAAGGIEESFNSPEAVARSASACIDFTTEPKLRAFFSDGTSKSYKLGLDVLTLRPEVWLLVGTALVFIYLGVLLLRGPRPDLLLRLSLWVSTGFLVYLGIALLRYPDLLQTYPLHAYVLVIITLATTMLAIYSIARPDHFKARSSNPNTAVVTVGVGIFWLWALSFGRYVPGETPFNELFWLPFFVWVFLTGMGLLLWTHLQPRKPEQTNGHSRRIRVIIALLFLALSLARDVVLVGEYGIRIAADSDQYVTEGRDFLVREQAERLPKRILPYVLLNFVTQAWKNPIPLIMVQSIISAVSIAFLSYVLSSRYLWLGAGAGLLLALNLALGMFNRTLLSESSFVSFHVLCFAFIAWHIQRRRQLSLWELFAFGLLCGWTFLIRGTGLGLIVPVILLYAYITRSWIKPLTLLVGFAVFLLGVSSYNQWRYGHAGLIGPQDSTLASSLFSYHLFSPENGTVSRQIDDHLRNCMGYLDYDDVPRYRNNFIYGAFQPCLFSNMRPVEVASATSSALRELALRRPFDLSRVLIEEAGIGLAYPMHHLFHRFAYDQGAPRQFDRLCRDLYGSVCDGLPDYESSPPGSPITILNKVLTYPSQIYLAVEQISSRSPIVILTSFIMLCGFLWVTTHEKLLVIWCTGFVFYQLLTVSIAHVFIPRYGIILPPFVIVLSVLAIGTVIQGLSRFRRGMLQSVSCIRLRRH